MTPEQRAHREAAIKRLVDSAPPLTPEQLAHLRPILGPLLRGEHRADKAA